MPNPGKDGSSQRSFSGYRTTRLEDAFIVGRNAEKSLNRRPSRTDHLKRELSLEANQLEMHGISEQAIRNHVANAALGLFQDESTRSLLTGPNAKAGSLTKR